MKYRNPVSSAATALALCLALASLSAARADGPEVGEGSWVCRDKTDGHVRWAKGVDLFVMNDETGLNPIQYPLPAGDYPAIVDAIQSRVQAVEPDFAARLGQALKRFNYLKPGTAGVTYTDDEFSLPNFGFNLSGTTGCDSTIMRGFRGGFYSGSLGCVISGTATPILISFPTIPNIADCVDGILAQSRSSAENSTVPVVPFETAISYDDDMASTVHVQQGIWTAFSDSDKAAAVLHVAVDWVVRNQYGAKDSVLARDLTEALFAAEDATTSAQRMLILLANAPLRPADDGSGYILALKPGIYQEAGGETLTLLPDPTGQTITMWTSLFQSSPPPQYTTRAEIDSGISSVDCSKAGPYQCQASPYTTGPHMDALSSTSILLGGGQWQWTAPPLGDLGTLTPARPYATNFVVNIPVYSDGTQFHDIYGPVSVGPAQIEVASVAVDGSPTIQVSGNPMQGIPTIDPNSDPTQVKEIYSGSGLASSATFTLQHSEGPLYVASAQPATVTLRNGTTCQITPTFRLLYMLDAATGQKAATIQLEGWPEFASDLKATKACHQVPGGFLGLGHKTVCTTSMTESITTCAQLANVTITSDLYQQIEGNRDDFEHYWSNYTPRVELPLQ